MTLATRTDRAEILDGDGYAPEELAGNLADMGFFHRWAGGEAILRRGLDAFASGHPRGARISILDVGAGGADAATLLAERARRRGLRPLVVAADLSERMAVAGRQRNEDPSVRACVADGRRLPHPDGAFDLAVSSLVLHHLADAAIEEALREMRRVTRLGFVVADLRRSRLALVSVWALTRLASRNRVTRHDGPLSVRRSLTPGELAAIARRAGLGGTGAGTTCQVVRRGLARLVLTYSHAPADGRPGRPRDAREGRSP